MAHPGRSASAGLFWRSTEPRPATSRKIPFVENGTALSICVVYDVVCPWCYVGEKQLDAALAERPDLLVSVDYHPFLLHPGLGPEGVDRDELLARKFGGSRVADAFKRRLLEVAERVGIQFAFAPAGRVPDTLPAHCVVRWTPQPKRRELVMRMYRAYFEEGRDVGCHAELATLAAGIGLDRDEILARLDTGEDRDAVRAHADDMRREGVTGVPFFVIDGRFAIPGAQEPQTLLAVIDGARRMCTSNVC